MMTLKKIVIYIYIALMLGSMPLYFWGVIGHVGGFFSIVFCLVEMVFFFYAGGFLTCRRLSFMSSATPGWDGGDSGVQKN